MQYRVNLSKVAKQDLEHIYDYIANNLEAPYGALKIISTIKKGITLLSVFSEAGSLAPEKELADEGVRVLHAYKYRIYYSVEKPKKLVHVHTILHHLQNTPKIEEN